MPNILLFLFGRQVMSDLLRPHGLQQAWLPVPHHLLEFAQVRGHSISDAIQLSHPQFSSVAQSCPTLQPHGLQLCQASLSITNSRSLLKQMFIESVMPSNHLILCRPLFSCLQSFPASGSFPRSQFFPSGSQTIGFQLQHQSFRWIFRTDFL